MRWCIFGTDFFVCDCEKLKMYWMYIEFFGKMQAGNDVPKMCRRINQWFLNNLPPESRVRQCKELLYKQLNKMNMVDAAELRAYIDRIVADMDKVQIAAMEKSPNAFALKIRAKIESLLEVHYRETFEKWLETEHIVCLPSYKLPQYIHPASHTDIYARSLYTAEDDDMNKLEQKLIMELTALPNVRWWHRNIARHGFAINGFIKHYPDIMLMTESGKIILVETKGEHLKNDDSREKIALGDAWRHAAGGKYRYYMVFEGEDNLLPGAISMGKDFWYPTTVRSILQNEKYCGDALMQKTYTPNFKTHRSVPNTELNKYLKEEHHVAIIKKSDWKKVQELLAMRRDVGRVVTLRKLANRFVAPRVKDGIFKGFYIFDSRWTATERREFLKIIDELTNNSTTKGENDYEI